MIGCQNSGIGQPAEAVLDQEQALADHDGEEAARDAEEREQREAVESPA